MVDQANSDNIPYAALKSLFDTPTKSVHRFGSGIVNKTYLVTTSNGQKNILQCLSPIFNEVMVKDFDEVTKQLQKAGWEVPSIVPTLDGKLYLKDAEGKLWRRLTFIASEPVKVPVLDDTTLSEIGSLLARFHKTLATISYKPSFQIPHFHETEYFGDRLAKLQASMPSLETKELAVDILEAYKGLPSLPGASTQLIHGDPQRSNILFRNGKPFTYIDFDTVMPANIWPDIGDLLRSLAEDSKKASAPFPLEKLEKVIDGYTQVSQPITDQIKLRDSCVAAMKIITLELAMRFLIDIVEDNYFAWDNSQYPSRQAHNLERAKLQWSIYNDYV
ncbi:phosphotransferase [Candidatus Saccharibacteria bacterium]|nr:phosphotransferase [Candidatus Saccharibacteria bacterium]